MYTVTLELHPQFRGRQPARQGTATQRASPAVTVVVVVALIPTAAAKKRKKKSTFSRCTSPLHTPNVLTPGRVGTFRREDENIHKRCDVSVGVVTRLSSSHAARPPSCTQAAVNTHHLPKAQSPRQLYAKKKSPETHHVWKWV